MSRPDPNNPPGQRRLQSALRTRIRWTRTNDVHRPFRAVVNGEAWVVRLGDFPAEPLYTLVVNSEDVGSFDTWPDAWIRSPG